MAQPLPIHSWKLIVPCEVSAVKLGASSFIRNIVCLLVCALHPGTFVPNLQDLNGVLILSLRFPPPTTRSFPPAPLALPRRSLQTSSAHETNDLLFRSRAKSLAILTSHTPDAAI